MVKTDGEAIIALQVQVSDIQTSIIEIKSDIKNILANLAATTTANTLQSKDISDLKLEIKALKEKEGFWSWLKPTLAAVAGSILTLLILSFLNRLK